MLGTQKEAPLPGLKKGTSPRRKNFLGAYAGGASILARFFAVFFVHFFLLFAGLTGLVIRLLLLAWLLPTAALLTTLAALLFLLFALIGHPVIS
jgi:hypothetical protein